MQSNKRQKSCVKRTDLKKKKMDVQRTIYRSRDVSHEFLKPIRPRHVANSESDVARLPWSCSDLESKLGRIVILKEWLTSSLAEHSSTNSLCLTNHRLVCSEHKACTSGRPPQRNLMLLGRTADHGKCKLTKPWMTQLLTEAKGLAEHVHHTTIAGVMCPIRSQLAGTKGTWQGRAAAVTAALQVLGDRSTFLESWLWTEHRSDHQSDSDTRPVPNYLRWVPRKRAPSLDKWTLFPGINTNSLTPTVASRHLSQKHIFLLSS